MMISSRNSILATTLTLAALSFSACSSGGGGGGNTVGQPGQLLAKPAGGGEYVVDENQGGKPTRLQLLEMTWGRLVDVFDVDASGQANPVPVFKDWVINENVQTDGANYRLETNPITLATRLVILREKDGPNLGNGTFETLLRNASASLPPITPKHDNGTSSAPFSFMARNSCLSLRFNDVLDDSAAAADDLTEAIEVLTGYAPDTPFRPRILFDPNYGAVVNGQFHSTRVLIDMTVSDTESLNSGGALPVNSLGLPASQTSTDDPNVSVRIATVEDPASGRFNLLRAFSGVPLSNLTNGPVDTDVDWMPVVRAFRGGNEVDSNNGFLLDLNPPQIVGSWPLDVDGAQDDPGGLLGFDFQLDIEFSTICQDSITAGDTISVGPALLEVVESTSPPVNSRLTNVRVRSLGDAPIASPGLLFGAGSLLSTYDTLSSVEVGCWVSFAPQAAMVPVGDVSTGSQVQVRFSEPMDPLSATPFESFMILRGASGSAVIEAENVVIGTTEGSPDLREFAFTPILPFSHQQGSSEVYNIQLAGVTDLAGNPLRDELPSIDFSIEADQPTELNASVAYRFSSLDEVKPVDVDQGVDDDVRGQIFYDFDEGVIRPRAVSFTAFAADRANPVPSIMIPFPPGLQTPLSALGSRLMTVWRYADLGWNARDETKYNMDVYGLSWSPVGGVVQRDFFEEFEIRLSHSRYQPDEDITENLLPKYTRSGLRDGPSPFTDNILSDPIAGQKIVHERSLGYIVDPADVSTNLNGTPLMPFPLNRTGQTSELTTYTWRDTRGIRRGGPSGSGVPLDIEGGDPLQIIPGSEVGKLFGVNRVKTIGLPLLMEYRCFPSDSGLGLNPLDISLAINSSRVPNFRCFSTGGVDTNGRTVMVNPSTENAPRGGYNPTSNPPGRRTRFTADNSFYIGQLDVVTRISQAFTAWVDTLYVNPRYLDPVMIPNPADQPPGTQVLLEYRGAIAFGEAVGDRAFDSVFINPYGDVVDQYTDPTSLPNELFVAYRPSDRWQDQISDIDGASFFQLRITFVNNIATGLNPELSAIGLAFVEQQ